MGAKMRRDAIKLNPWRDADHDPRRGAALLFVVVIVGLLALAVVEFQRRTHLESLSAANSVRALQAHSLSRSGFAAAAMLLREDMLNSTIDDRNEDWFPGEGESSAMPIPVGSAVVTIRIEDQSGKFPIASVIDDQGQLLQDRADALLKLFQGLELEGPDPYDLTYALIDWIDPDSNGEFEYNEYFTVPNTAPHNLDELGRIAGFDELSPAQLAELSRHLDTRVAPEINALTASALVLHSVSPTLSLEDAEALYDELVSDPGQINTAIPQPTRLMPLTSKSERFRVLIGSDVGGVTRKVDCILVRDPKQKAISLAGWTQF